MTEHLHLDQQGIQETADAPADAGSTSKLTKRVLLISGFATFMTGYAHFFGYSYIRALIEAVGLEGFPLELSVQESLYQALSGLVAISLHTDVGTLLSAVLKPALASGILVFLMVFGVWIASLLKTPLVSRLQTAAKSNNPAVNFGRSLIFSLSSGVYAFVLWYAAVVILAAALMLAILSLGLGAIAGEINGHAMVDSNVCLSDEEVRAEIELDPTKKFRFLCISIPIAGRAKPLIGTPIFADSEHTYFVTNDASFVISRAGAILMERRFKSSGAGMVEVYD